MSAVSSKPLTRSRRAIGISALLFGAVILAYWPALQAQLIWDDEAHVTTASLRSWAGLGRIWTEVGVTQQYYPLLHSAFWLEYRLWNGNPLGYHLTNVALHALAAGLFALVLRRLAIPGAILAAALFALHPVHVESVAWISEQKNTLSTALYLGAALAYLRFDMTRGRGAYVLATGCFVLGLLTKTVVATLPAALLIVFWWRRGALSWRRDVLPLLPWLVIGTAAGLFTSWVERRMLGAEGAAFDLTLVQRGLIAGRALWFYLAKLTWPANLTFIYPRWTIDPSKAWSWVPLAAALGVLVGLWWIRRRSRAPLAVALLFAGTLFPALGFFNVYPFQYSFVADHFAYAASLPLVAAAGAMAAATFGRLQSPGLSRTATVFATGALALLAWSQAWVYRSNETLFRATVARNPDAWMAWNNLGKELMTATPGAPEAIACLERALALRTDYPEAHNNLGLALTQAGRARDAIPHLEISIRLRPGSFQTHNNLGIALASSGRAEEALRAFEHAAALNPTLPNIQENWAKALLLLGRKAEAEEHFAAASRLRASGAK